MVNSYEFHIKLKLLMDMLKVKSRLLQQILNITENQESILLNGETSEELNFFFNGMSREKQRLIDEVIQADNAFQAAFESIGDDFERLSGGEKPLIAELQALIKQAVDFDVKIRVQEQRNRELTEKFKKGKKIELPKASKKHVLKQYKKYSEKDET